MFNAEVTQPIPLRDLEAFGKYLQTSIKRTRPKVKRYFPIFGHPSQIIRLSFCNSIDHYLNSIPISDHPTATTECGALTIFHDIQLFKKTSVSDSIVFSAKITIRPPRTRKRKSIISEELCESLYELDIDNIKCFVKLVPLYPDTSSDYFKNVERPMYDRVINNIMEARFSPHFILKLATKTLNPTQYQVCINAIATQYQHYIQEKEEEAKVLQQRKYDLITELKRHVPEDITEEEKKRIKDRRKELIREKHRIIDELTEIQHLLFDLDVVSNRIIANQMNLIVLEYVENSITLGSYTMGLTLSTPEQLADFYKIVFQIYYNLVVMANLKLTHYDLHIDNIMLKRLTQDSGYNIYIINRDEYIIVPFPIDSYVVLFYDWDYSFHDSVAVKTRPDGADTRETYHEYGIVNDDNSNHDLYRMLTELIKSTLAALYATFTSMENALNAMGVADETKFDDLLVIGENWLQKSTPPLIYGVFEHFVRQHTGRGGFELKSLARDGWPRRAKPDDPESIWYSNVFGIQPFLLDTEQHYRILTRNSYF
jgi:hypothetical protein